MRIIFAAVLACAVAGMAWAAEEAGKVSKAATTVVEKFGGTGAKHLDDISGDPASVRGSTVDHIGVMPPEQSYDDSTGLPNMVPSDTRGEAE